MRQAGFRSMRDVALDAVAQGVTSIDEVNRVLADDDSSHVQARAKNRVLVVDDDRMIRMLVKLLLEKEGYDVIEGENGLQAVELARRERPDLIVLDLMMPEMDGFAVLDALKADKALSEVPVIVVTAKELTAIERQRLAGKARSLLQKGTFTDLDIVDYLTDALA
jgi:threonine synthase